MDTSNMTDNKSLILQSYINLVQSLGLGYQLAAFMLVSLWAMIVRLFIFATALLLACDTEGQQHPEDLEALRDRLRARLA